MPEQLKGRRIAIVVENGFEQVELTEPRKALDDAGAKTEIVSPAKGKVKGWKSTEWGDEFPVDRPVRDARAEECAAFSRPANLSQPFATGRGH